MSNETLKDYVRDERAKGVTDEAIRAELLAKGWKEEVISEVLPNATDVLLPPSPSSVIATETETIAQWGVAIGLASILVSTALLYHFGAGRELENRVVFSAFSVTHVINAITAVFLFMSAWRISRAITYRIFVAVFSIVVALFAISSLAHFASLATGLGFFETVERALIGDTYLPLFIYFLLLPLQAVVFLLLACTLWVLKVIRKRRGEMLSIKRVVSVALVFLLIALIGLGDLYLVLDGIHF